MATKKEQNEILTDIKNIKGKVNLLFKFEDNLDKYIRDEEGFPVADLDEKGQPKLDKNGEIIYLKKEKAKKKTKAKPGFLVRYKNEEERAKMQALAMKYTDSIDERTVYSDYVRKVTTRDVYAEIKELERKLKTAENKVNYLEKEIGMTTAELKRKKKEKKQD
jgi:hypothetical protein